MVLLLAAALDVPLREQNALLLAAGFAPEFAESKLDAPELAAVSGALAAILRQQEPFPAVVMNRHWDILNGNEAASCFFGFLRGKRPAPTPANVLRMMFHPDGLRQFVSNWEAVGEALVRRAHREAVGAIPDQKTRELLAEILAFPGVPQAWRNLDSTTRFLPVVPVNFKKEGREFNFFSTVTTLGTPQDVTLQEIRIECFFPADPATERAARQLRDEAS
jgi:hypothetical protein